MKIVAGLWIDRKKAVIVVATDQGHEIKVIVSNVDKQFGRAAGVRSTTSYEPQLVPADDRRERQWVTARAGVAALLPADRYGEIGCFLPIRRWNVRQFQTQLLQLVALQCVGREIDVHRLSGILTWIKPVGAG